MSKTTFKLSEDFYSVQCEGLSTGYPAYFVRLTDCNLACGFTQKMLNQIRKGEITDTAGTIVGDLQDEGLATWTCDSAPVWLKGREVPFQYLIDRWKEQGIYEDICSGLIHIIWTGGEPTLKYHQESIIEFNKWWFDQEPKLKADAIAFNSSALGEINSLGYQEIETNGTIFIEEVLMKILTQINCSAKLANSGMSEKKRIVPEAINRIMEHPKYSFKFVISTEEDIEEFMKDYVKPFNMPLNKVICMPGLDKQEDFHERTRFVLEMAKIYKFIGLTRLHISAWNQATGV